MMEVVSRWKNVADDNYGGIKPWKDVDVVVDGDDTTTAVMEDSDGGDGGSDLEMTEKDKKLVELFRDTTK